MKVGDLVKLRVTSWVDPQYWGEICIIVRKLKFPIDIIIPDADECVKSSCKYIHTFEVLNDDGYLIESMRKEDLELLEININEKKQLF